MRISYDYWIYFLTDRVFGPHASSQEVYEIAARPVVQAAMEGVNGMAIKLQELILISLS